MGPSKGSNPSYDGYNQFAFLLWTWARELRWWKGRLQMVSGWRVHKRVAGVQHNLLTEIFSSRTGWSCYNYISPCSYKILWNASQTRCGVRDRNQQVVGEKKWTENGRSEEVIVQWYVGWWNSGLLLEFTKRTMLKKKKKKPLSDLSTEAGREGWGLAWLLSSCWSKVLLPHTVWGSMNTDTFWDLCPLPVTNCNSGIKTKNLIAADRDFFFVCVCSWQLSSQLFLCCTAQQLSQSNCVSNNIAENSWSVKTYGTPCVLLVPSVLFNWPPSSNFLAPILYKCMIFPSWIAGERMRIFSAALEPGAQAGVLKLAGLGG